jgi:hypothetical protein
MSDLPEENTKPKGFLNKLTAFWNSLNNSIKALSGVLAAILIILTQFDKIKKILFPEISEETLNKIVHLDTLTADERDEIFNECAKFEVQCLDALLNECEGLRSGDEAQKESIIWIYKSNNKIGNDEIYDACIIKANVFLDEGIYTMSNEEIANGFKFYIGLFIKFKPDHNEEVLQLYDKMKMIIEENPELDPLTKRVLNDKIEQAS